MAYDPQYNTSLPTLSNLQKNAGQCDVNGRLLVSSTSDSGYSVTRVIADGQIKGSAGVVHTITIAPTGSVVAGVLTVYNSLTETGTVLFSVSLPVTTFTPFTVTLDAAASTGIYVGFDGTLSNVGVTVTYS